MKLRFALILLALLLACCVALAEEAAPAAEAPAETVQEAEAPEEPGAPQDAGIYIGEMKVTNVNQAVNFREGPSTEAARLAQVSLGDTVTDCAWMGDEFIRCVCDGAVGYIHRDYLAIDVNNRPDTIYDETVGEVRLHAERAYRDDGEHLILMRLRSNDRIEWACETAAGYSELEGTSFFTGGGRAMLYSADRGLTAVELSGGETLWQQPEAAIGGNICSAVSDDGTIYLCGYYGPDPMAIDAGGNVLWRADFGSGTYWRYAIELREDGVAAYYEGLDNGDHAGWVIYDYSGNLLRTEYGPMEAGEVEG